MSMMQKAKSALRAEMLARRNAMSEEEIAEKSADIVEIACALPSWQQAGVVCSYLAIGSEVRSAALIEKAFSQGMVVALPRTDMQQKRLTLHPVSSLKELLQGPFGLLEPPADSPNISPADIELFIIPGMAFDARGNRLGYGAGFYDQLLKNTAAPRLALAFAQQIAPNIPVDEWDVPLDLLVTDDGVIDCKMARRSQDHLRLHNIKLLGHHGVYAEEREKGVWLSINIDMQVDLQQASLSDRLETAIDYSQIIKLIDEVQQRKQYLLLEGLAGTIAQAILEKFPAIHAITVGVRKMNPPVPALLEAFEVEITRKREEYR